MGWIMPLKAKCDTCRDKVEVSVPLVRLQFGSPPVPDGWHSDGTVFECPECYAKRMKVLLKRNDPRFCPDCGAKLLVVAGSCSRCSARKPPTGGQ